MTHHHQRSVSVFSTSVEVFPPAATMSMIRRRLLHVRGGVSKGERAAIASGSSSPRPWRCFHFRKCQYPRPFVFSTSVEVFPKQFAGLNLLWSLLHVRGGVSAPANGIHPDPWSSPRPWRCFLRRVYLGNCQYVFSTSVEVFLEKTQSCTGNTSLLHVRGGVSLQRPHSDRRP